MKKKMTFGKHLITTAAATVLVMAMGITAFAAEETDNLQMEIGGTVMDIRQLAEENDVDPYELKAAIEEGLDAEKASPFSCLATNTPNTEATESVKFIHGRSAASTYGSVMVSKEKQDSTAYVAKEGQVTANGKTPQIGMCAMKISSTTKTGQTTDKIVRLGTTIYMEDPVDVNGTSYSSFVVEDRGSGDNRTNFWIDIFFGQYVDKTSDTYKAAINYGVKEVSYHYYY